MYVRLILKTRSVKEEFESDLISTTVDFLYATLVTSYYFPTFSNLNTIFVKKTSSNRVIIAKYEKWMNLRITINRGRREEEEKQNEERIEGSSSVNTRNDIVFQLWGRRVHNREGCISPSLHQLSPPLT